MSEAPVLVQVRRSDLVESEHRGHVVIVDAEGRVRAALGDPDVVIYPRSAVKPLQAVAMLEAGLGVDGSDLALSAASHSGEPFHVVAVRSMLAAVDLDEGFLQCPPDLPAGEQARTAHLAAGGGPQRVLMNCSGKHAAMLRTCVVNGWPLDSYLDPQHRLQEHIRATIAGLADCEPGPPSVDGCGAPLWPLPLVGLARAMSAVLDRPAGARVASAMRAYPEFSGGTTRDVTQLMRGLPGVVAKDGAESVQAMVAETERGWFGVALKVLDGSERARPVVAAAALRALGLDSPVLTELAEAPILGGGRRVGAVQPSALLAGMTVM